MLIILFKWSFLVGIMGIVIFIGYNINKKMEKNKKIFDYRSYIFCGILCMFFLVISMESSLLAFNTSLKVKNVTIRYTGQGYMNYTESKKELILKPVQEIYGSKGYNTGIKESDASINTKTNLKKEKISEKESDPKNGVIKGSFYVNPK